MVALADNDHQGIVPVPRQLGDGDDPANNLYWGARYGVKTYFRGPVKKAGANPLVWTTGLMSPEA